MMHLPSSHTFNQVTLRRLWIADFVCDGRIRLSWPWGGRHFCGRKKLVWSPFRLCGVATVLGVITLVMGMCIQSVLIPFSLCIELKPSNLAVIGSEIAKFKKGNDVLSSTSFETLRFLPVAQRRLAPKDFRFGKDMEMIVFYRDRRGGNLLVKERLEKIRAWENTIVNWPPYANRRVLDETFLTPSPPLTFMNFLYPSSTFPQPIFDGKGSTITPNIESTLRLIASSGQTPYFDLSFSSSNLKSVWLVSAFPFRKISPTETDASIDSWMKKSFASFLKQIRDEKDPDIEMAYVDGRGGILGQEVLDQLGADLKLAAFSLVIIFVVVWLFTRSIFISFFGIVGVLLSFLPSLVVYTTFFGNFFSTINFVGVWIILGIGADDMFVFLSSYRRAPVVALDGSIIPERLRLAFAYREAGYAMFVTSITTSFSFYSLLANPISPLPNFGVFIGTLVLTNYLLVMTWFPCIVVLYVKTLKYVLKTCCGNQPPAWFFYLLAIPVAISEDDDAEDGDSEDEDDWISKSDPSQPLKGVAMSPHFRQSVRDSQLRDVFPASNRASRASHIFMPRYGLAHDHFITKWIERATMKLESFENDYFRSSRAIDGRESVDDDEFRRVTTLNNIQAQKSFSGCTNCCFAILGVRGCAPAMIILALTSLIWFGLQAARVQPAKGGIKLLPRNTNFGMVQAAQSFVSQSIDAASAGGTASSAIGGGGPDSDSTNTDPIELFITPSPTLSPTRGPVTSDQIAFPESASRMACAMFNKRNVTYPGDLIVCGIQCRVATNISLSFLNESRICWSNSSRFMVTVNQNFSNRVFHSEFGRNNTGVDFIVANAVFPILAPLRGNIFLRGWVWNGSNWISATPEQFNQSIGRIENNGINISVTPIPPKQRQLGSVVEISFVWGVDNIHSGKPLCDPQTQSESSESQLTTVDFRRNFRLNVRFLIEFCRRLAGLEHVMYAGGNVCFGDELLNYLNQTNSSVNAFVARSVNDQTEIIKEFLLSPRGIHFREQVGFHNVSLDRITWFRESWKTQITTSSGASNLNSYYLKFKKFESNIASITPPEMGRGFITSPSWVFMEASLAFVSGFAQSIGYTIALCGIAVLFFTRNYAMTLLVLGYVVCVGICCIGMFETMNLINTFSYSIGVLSEPPELWTLGPIEVLIVPTVIGLTIDYALHISHAYVHSHFDSRYYRVKSSIEDLGLSVLCSALTTVFSMVILALTVIVLFSTMGKIVSVTISIGIIFSLVVIPSLLLYIGPQGNQCAVTCSCLSRKREAASSSWMPIPIIEELELETVQEEQMNSESPDFTEDDSTYSTDSDESDSGRNVIRVDVRHALR